MGKRYCWRNIRLLLAEGFSVEELRRLRYDQPDFRPVFDDISQSSDKSTLIYRLLEHAEQKLLVDQLLAWAEETNPERYAQHRPYIEGASAAGGKKRPRKKAAAAARPACPYPGMVPFGAKHAPYFYGRENQIRHMLRHLRHYRQLFVIGPSGSGKSSLVRIGLLENLPESTLFEPNYWVIRDVNPGSRPWDSLALALQGLPEDPAPAVADLLARHTPAQRLLLVIDQFEEIFTQAERTQQARFIAALQGLRQVENCTLVVVMRADFYPNLMDSDLWPVEANQRLEIAPLRGEALRRAVLKPAMDVGIHLEEGLLERLLADAADEPGVLPLVQETMVLLWEEIQDGLIPRDAYDRLGREGQTGLAVAVATKADAVLANLSPAQQNIARRIFLRLVQFGEGRADTRRRQPVRALMAPGDDPALFKQTLNYLTDNRLLTTSGEEKLADRQVDVAHEALINGWPTFRTWLSEQRESERTRRRLEDKANEWVRLGRGRGGLLAEVELLEVKRWLQSPNAADPGHDLAALIEASQAEVKRLRDEVIAAAVGAATAAIQHRLNNTLNIIRPNITSLRRRVDTSNKAIAEILDLIERNVLNTSGYIQRIQESLKETEVGLIDINASLREAHNKVRQQAQEQPGPGPVEVDYNLDRSLPLIEAPVGQVTEVFRNLIENAYKAMGKQGGRLTVTSRQTDGWIEVEVQDTGPGIPENIRDRLFQKPVPSKQPSEGSGLGLWLSWLLLQKYAGDIIIKNTSSAGTTIAVRLPVSRS